MKIKLIWTGNKGFEIAAKKSLQGAVFVTFLLADTKYATSKVKREKI